MDHLMIISTRLSVTYPPSKMAWPPATSKKVEVCHVTEGFETSKRLIGRTPCTTSWTVGWGGCSDAVSGTKKRLLKRLKWEVWWCDVLVWFSSCCEVVSLKKCHVVPANCTFTNDSATPMAYDVNSGRKQLFQPQYIAVRQWECGRLSLLFTDNWKSFLVSRFMHKLCFRICIEHPSAGDIVRHFVNEENLEYSPVFSSLENGEGDFTVKIETRP